MTLKIAQGNVGRIYQRCNNPYGTASWGNGYGEFRGGITAAFDH